MKTKFLIAENADGGATIPPASGLVKKETLIDINNYAVEIEIWDNLGYISLKTSDIDGDEVFTIPVDVDELIEAAKLISHIKPCII